MPEPGRPDPGRPEPGQHREPDARSRARRALSAVPGRGQVVVAVLLGLLGFAAAVQITAIDSDDDFAGARRDDLVQLLQTLSAAQDRATRQLGDLENTRDALQASSDQRQTALDAARRQLESLRLLAGQVAATGPGVVITIQDPDGNVASRTLLNVVEELRDAGGEAIEVNNTARVVAQTWFGEGPDPADAALVVDGEPVSAPYVLEVIGDPGTLADAVQFPGGLDDEVTALGGTVAVTQSDSLQIESLTTARDTGFAEPST